MLAAQPASATAQPTTGGAGAAVDPRLAELASPSPFRGLVYTGLALGRKGSECDGAFEAKTPTGASLGCSHGPDPAPPGVDVRRGRSDQQLAGDAHPALRRAAAAADVAGSAAASLGSVGCIGDGISGQRVHAIYALPAGHTDRP